MEVQEKYHYCAPSEVTSPFRLNAVWCRTASPESPRLACVITCWFVISAVISEALIGSVKGFSLSADLRGLCLLNSILLPLHSQDGDGQIEPHLT